MFGHWRCRCSATAATGSNGASWRLVSASVACTHAAEQELEGTGADMAAPRKALGKLQRQSVEARVVAIGPVSGQALMCMALVLVAALALSIRCLVSGK